MDATREHLFGRILLERRVIGEDDLRRIVGERDDLIRRGGRATLGQLLVRERRIEPSQMAAIQGEIELRGRACFNCRRAFLVAAGGPVACPACGGPALLPAVPPPAAAAPEGYSASGRFGPGSFAPPSNRYPAPTPSSGRFRAPPGVGAPQPVPVGAGMNGMNGGMNGMNALHDPLSGRFNAGALGLMPSLASPHGTTPGSRGSDGQVGQVRQGADLGKTLGPYELVQELGRGGMGVVYKARHCQNGQMVALKVLLSGEFASPKMLKRFEEEAKTVQKLSHENIVPVFDVGEIEGIHYFTMKFVEGELLQELIKNRGLAARRGAEILRDVARGAHHAHEHGIVHRDLKPANVIVETTSDTPFIMDFGLAKNLEEDKHLTKSGVAIGTPYYMSPEQAQGRHREIDARSDVYALGAMLYEVLARRVPFNAESQTLLLRKIVEEDPIPPSKVRPGVPRDLEIIALKAIRKKKEERYDSAEDFAADLERSIRGERILARAEAFWKPWMRKLQKNRRLAVGLTAGLVIAVAGLGFGGYMLHQKRIEEDRQRIEKRRTEAAALATEGKAKRSDAQRAGTAALARGTLDDAISKLTNALDLAEPGSETEAIALYERGCARRDAGQKGDAVLDDLKKAGETRSHRARARLALATFALRREHDLARAKTELEGAKEPGTPTEQSDKVEEEMASILAKGWLSLISANDALGAAKSFQDAERQTRELAVEASEAQAHAYLTLVIAGQKQHAATALRAAERGAGQDHWRYTLLCDRALARVLNNQPRQAADDIQAAKEICPEAREIKLAEAWLALRANKPLDAVRAPIAEAKRDQPGAAAYWDQCLNRLVQAYEDSHKKRAPFDDTRPAPPKAKQRKLWLDFGISYEDKFEDDVKQVQAAVRAKDIDTAIKLLEKIDNADSANGTGVALWRARLLLESQKPAEAEKIVLRILGKEPENTFALALAGALEDKPEKAVEYLSKCLEKDPQLRTPRILLAHVLMQAQQYGDVEKVLRPLWNAQDERDIDVEAVTLMGQSLVRTNRAESALSMLWRSMQAAPAVPGLRLTLTFALRTLQRHEECLPLNEEGERLFPQFAQVFLDKAITLSLLGRGGEADDYFRRASQLAKSEDERAQIKSVEQEVKRKR